MLVDGMYQMAATRVGQHALTFMDRILCIVEALNFFSVPEDQRKEAHQDGKESQDYRRPLPWFLFIPMLFYFRLVRILVSIMAMPFKLQVTAMMMVHYLQSVRRKLRYVKIQVRKLRFGSLRETRSKCSIFCILRALE